MVELHELSLVGRLQDFTRCQQNQMAEWVRYYMERDGHCGPGVVESARRIVARANQGSIWPVSVATIDGLIDKRTGLRGDLDMSEEHIVEKVAYTLCTTDAFQLLDHCFMVYGDGSIMVAYETTGFIVDHTDSSIIMHPETRFSFQLTELDYDLGYGRKVIIDGCELPITSRTLFFYRLVQACTAILESALQPTEGGDA